jgi:hypothetical protein
MRAHAAGAALAAAASPAAAQAPRSRAVAAAPLRRAPHACRIAPAAAAGACSRLLTTQLRRPAGLGALTGSAAPLTPPPRFIPCRRRGRGAAGAPAAVAVPAEPSHEVSYTRFARACGVALSLASFPDAQLPAAVA